MPDAPVQIIANASSSAPTAPVQIAANGSGSTPTAPVQVAANGSGSTPSAPPSVEPAGLLTGNATISGALTDGTNPVVFPILLKIEPDLAATFGRNWTSTGIAYPDALGMFYSIGTVLVFGVGRRWTLKVGNYTSDLISPTSGATWESDTYPSDAMPNPWLATGWAATGGATGTPIVSGGQPAPVQITANGSGSTPTAPPAIV